MNSSSSTTPTTTTYSQDQLSAFSTWNAIELICHFLLDCPFSALNFFLIFKTSILHPNLKVILLCQSACIFLRGIARISLNISRINLADPTFSGSPLLIFFFIQPTYIRNFIVHVLVIERIIATLNYKNYERQRGFLFSAVWIFITTLVALLNGFMTSYAPKQIGSYISLATYGMLFIFGFLEILSFLWILKRNDQIYRQKLDKTESLSEKYQLAENIRTARQLIPCILFHIFNIFYGAAGNVFTYFKPLGTDKQFFYDLTFNFMLFPIVSAVSFGIELSMILFHPFLKRDLLHLWKKIRRLPTFGLYSISNQSSSISPTNGGQNKKMSSVKNVHGKALINSKPPQELGQEYFRLLNESWR